MIHCKRSSQ